MGHRFVSDWKMVWEEIAIGFTIAGFVAVIVPPRIWEFFFAGVMYASIVATALTLHYLFALFDIIPESGRRVEEVAQFAFDYTFYMNVVFVAAALGLVWLNRRHMRDSDSGMDHEKDGGLQPKRILAILSLVMLFVGLIVFFLSKQ